MEQQGEKFRWVVLFMLFAATTINYLDRQILSLLKPILDEEFGWNDQQYGMIMSCFQAAYAIGLTGFGWIIDRFGTKIGYSISIVWWSLGAILHSCAQGIFSMGICRVVLGLGEGGNFPASVKTVSTWFPPKERVFATTLFNSGANVGAMVAPAVIPFIALAWGWKSAFIIAGALGLIWVLFWLKLPMAPKKAIIESQEKQEPADPTEKIAWKDLLKYRQTWSLVIVRLLTDPIWWFFLFWLPDFFKKNFHCDIKESALPLFTIYALVTILSILGGSFTKYLSNLGWDINKVRKISMCIFALCVVPVIFAQYLNMWSIVAVVGLAGAAHQAWSANIYTLGSDMFPKSAVASITGLTSMAGQIGSVIFQSLVGVILFSFTQSDNAAAGYNIIFIICGLAYISAFIIFQLIIPKIKMITPQK